MFNNRSATLYPLLAVGNCFVKCCCRQTGKDQNDAAFRVDEKAAEKADVKKAEQGDAIAAWIDELKRRYEVEPDEQGEGNGDANTPGQSEAAETRTEAEEDDEPEGDEELPGKRSDFSVPRSHRLLDCAVSRHYDADIVPHFLQSFRQRTTDITQPADFGEGRNL